MKHIELEFIHAVVSRNYIKLEYISTENQITDMLTKALLKTKFYELLKLCSFKTEFQNLTFDVQLRVGVRKM